MKWILTILSIFGVVLNAHRKRVCFLVWMFTNFCWMIIDFKQGIPEQGTLFFIYFLLAIYGWVKWRKNEKEK